MEERDKEGRDGEGEGGREKERGREGRRGKEKGGKGVKRKEEQKRKWAEHKEMIK